MVKPAGTSLDVIADVGGLSRRPGRRLPGLRGVRDGRGRRAQGWIDRERAILETLTVIRRAGADIVLTYWAAEVAGWLADGRDDVPAWPPDRASAMTCRSGPDSVLTIPALLSSVSSAPRALPMGAPA